MLNKLFKSTPVIDDSSRAWILDSFVWCIENLDGQYFFQSSELVLPNNQFYPGKMHSSAEMAEAIFIKTKDYAGLSQWPLNHNIDGISAPSTMAQLTFSGSFRGDSCHIVNQNAIDVIEIAMHPSQLKQPQDLIAYLAQTFAGITIKQRGLTPPGGNNMLAEMIDMVACFMGFGVIFANTAYQFKGGCGSCNIRALNRQAALPEGETVYALAVYIYLKKLKVKSIKPSLKPHLYKLLRRAYKDVESFLTTTNNDGYMRLVHKKGD